jgi:sterol carrier protein 2
VFVEAIFAEMAKRSDASMVKKIGCTYRFDISDGSTSKSFFVNLKTGAGSITESSDKADCMIKMKDKDFVNLMNGKLNGQQAFMQGKMKITGNMMLAMKLNQLQAAKAKM